jgi:hypothetical protein
VATVIMMEMSMVKVVLRTIVVQRTTVGITAILRRQMMRIQ